MLPQKRAMYPFLQDTLCALSGFEVDMRGHIVDSLSASTVLSSSLGGHCKIQIDLEERKCHLIHSN